MSTLALINSMAARKRVISRVQRAQVGGTYNPFTGQNSPFQGQVGNGSWNTGLGNGIAAVARGVNWPQILAGLNKQYPNGAAKAGGDCCGPYNTCGGSCGGGCGAAPGAGGYPNCGPGGDPRVQGLNDGPCSYYQEPLGFDSVTAVTAGATVDVSATPLVQWRPRQLIVSSTISDSFGLLNIKSGKRLLFASAGGVPVPMAMYQPDSNASSFQGMTVAPNTPVTLQIVNTSADDIRFRAGMVGEAAE